jgi:hypothetical protein
MGMPKGRTGNPGGRPKLKPWTEALALVANEEEYGQKLLRKLARKTFDLAFEGDVAAIKEIGNRLEGTPMQAVQISGDEDAPLQIIKRVVVDPKAE